ncbi:MAG: hypothetical protein IJX17_00460 [Clostridia bacterium]|nr:hypothetical protein [Clostridia bacterium]
MRIKLGEEEQSFEYGATVQDILKGFSNEHTKGAVCCKINNKLIDLKKSIKRSCTIEIITKKSPEYIDILKHSASHILEQAVKTVFPTVKCWRASANKIGFYCDFDFKSPITFEDLSVIEDEMDKIIKAHFEITRKEMHRDEAIEIMKEANEPFKIELIESFSDKKKIILYSQGDFVEICSGPHIKSTDQIKHFKLTRFTGSYLKDNKFGIDKKLLTRIYGVVFEKKSELDDFMKVYLEKKKRFRKNFIK